MIPSDPTFLAWAARYGYAPWRPEEGQEREKYARYWLAWLAKIPPDCKKAHNMLRLSGLLVL